ncbi:MAG: 5'-methylthioadenosine/adenosylhomocysteine nucleosidase [Clostridiales bacterium]|jgi:adenosylhomocysteine nucleosidase|nr:5'-methylthioadenosine/adenosylhomocysteine nucleosidase [Bacillota bacterium]NLK04241.1 5'-methylthioadenosine/adenosylhomocysteine nucleosidase [Clostridiales bacterium]
MKKIGIIGAMEEEVARLKDMMQDVSIIRVASMDFCEGNIDGSPIVVVRSGIGKVNAGLCTQILIDRYGVDLVINTGIAGSLRNEIDIADIVISTDALQHDVDASGFGYDLGVIPRMENSIFKADEKLVSLAKKVCNDVIPTVGVHTGRIVSGDQFISDSEKKEWLAKVFDGYCTEMEGAAIAQASYLNGIPFLIIRAISDKADNSAEMAYSKFEAIAIENTVKLLMGLIKQID